MRLVSVRPHRPARSFTAIGTINSSVEHVYSWLAAVDDYRLWVPGLTTSGIVAGAPLLAGSKVFFEVSILGFQIPVRAELTELVRHERIGFRSVGHLELSGQWRLWPERVGTTVEFSMEFAMPGGALGWAARLADVQGILAAKGEQALKTLRKLVESSAA